MTDYSAPAASAAPERDPPQAGIVRVPGIWRLFAAAIPLAVVVWLALRSADTLVAPPPATAAEIDAPDESQEGYEYGARGSHLASGAIISSLAIDQDAHLGRVAFITIRKGPDYAANDPATYDYPGCTLLGALAGSFFEDTDSAQVVVCWMDRQNQMHVADNLIPGPTLGRTQAAVWDWADPSQTDAACVRLPIGRDAVSLTALVVYTDVLPAYTEMGPEDGPAVIASWDARLQNGVWHVVPRAEVGIGARPEMDPQSWAQSVAQVRRIVQEHTGGRYTLRVRDKIGQPSPAHPEHIIQYDSGFDIVPVLEGSVAAPERAAATEPGSPRSRIPGNP